MGFEHSKFIVENTTCSILLKKQSNKAEIKSIKNGILKYNFSKNIPELLILIVICSYKIIFSDYY